MRYLLQAIHVPRMVSPALPTSLLKEVKEAEGDTMIANGKRCKVQFRKPVTVTGIVSYNEDINKFQIVTDRGTSLIDPQDIIMIEEALYPERHESEVIQ